MQTSSGANFQIQYGFYTHYKVGERERARQQHDLNIEKKFPVFQTGTFNSYYYFTIVMY